MEPKDANDLADKIIWLINNPKIIEDMSKEAIEFAYKNFSEEIINKKHLSIYKKLLKKKYNNP